MVTVVPKTVVTMTSRRSAQAAGAEERTPAQPVLQHE